MVGDSSVAQQVSAAALVTRTGTVSGLVPHGGQCDWSQCSPFPACRQDAPGRTGGGCLSTPGCPSQWVLCSQCRDNPAGSGRNHSLGPPCQPVSGAALAPRHRSGCGRPASLRPHWAENIHFRCLSAAIKQHNADGRAGGAHDHAAGGAGAAAGGAGGEDWLPSTSQRGRCGCRGSCEAVGPLRKGWRAAERGPGCRDILCPTPARGGRRLLDTCGHHPQENFWWLQDAAQPRGAFPIVDGSCGTGGS